MAKAIQCGTERVGSREVPCYRPAKGVSVDEAARSIGLRCLARKEQRERPDLAARAEAVFTEGGLYWPCVTP